MGNQSTGKSYLLNELFDVNFKVMNSKEAISQTTEGVWLCADTDRNILAFDVEGSDSQERTSEGKGLERKIVLYALAM